MTNIRKNLHKPNKKLIINNSTLVYFTYIFGDPGVPHRVGVKTQERALAPMSQVVLAVGKGK